jgi:hypothetical protein
MTDEVKTDRAQVDGHFVRREASMPKWALLVLPLRLSPHTPSL